MRADFMTLDKVSVRDRPARVDGSIVVDFEQPDSETIGVEFTNTSISSNGDGSDVAPDWERIRRDNPPHQVPGGPSLT